MLTMSETESAPSIHIHSFEHKLCDTLVEYQVTRLQGQTMIWVGAGDRSLANLAAAVPGGDCPSTALLGQADQPAMLASRLAKKLNKQVFVSFNVPDDNILTPLVIEKLVAEIKLHPDKF